jgi:hypothetical protein
MSRTFQEIYCQRHRLPPEDYEQALFRQSLYGHARLTRGVLRLLLGRDYFRADLELIRHVADLSDWRHYRQEAAEYHRHHLNRGFARRVLRLRVSAGRLGRIIRQELPAG